MNQQLDMEKATALARQIVVDMGGAHLIALAYIADRLGIFRAMADGEPMTSQQLAERTGLNERYLREWASAMAAAQYIDYKPKDCTFRLTPEQDQVLVDERSPFFFAGGFQYYQAGRLSREHRPPLRCMARRHAPPGQARTGRRRYHLIGPLAGVRPTRPGGLRSRHREVSGPSSDLSWRRLYLLRQRPT